jgi:hypothetical protein
VLGPGRCLKLRGRFSKAAIGSSTAAPPTPDATTAVISLEQGMPNTADESMVIAEADAENSAERTEAEIEAEEKVHLLLTEVLQRCDSILETLSTCSSDLRRVKGGVVDRGTTSGVVLSGAIGVIRGGRGTKILTAVSGSLGKDDPDDGAVVGDNGVLGVCAHNGGTLGTVGNITLCAGIDAIASTSGGTEANGL